MRIVLQLSLDVLDEVAASSLLIVVGFYLSYAILCYSYARRRRLIITDVSEDKLRPLTIVIPTYNEANVMGARFENLRNLRYPRDRLQIVFVDGGSRDGTPELIEQLKGHLNIVLLKSESREGYNRALMDGFHEASGDLIAFTGAESEYDADALVQMVKHFSRADVGAVTGRQRIRNVNEISPAIEMGYRRLYDFIRLAESEMDSPFDIKGEICVGRREVVRELVFRQEFAKRGCIDTCLSFQSRLMGMRSVYEPSAIYYENSPYRVSESFAQDVRRGTTLIENMLLFRSMILNRHFGSFGVIIMPAHFMMLMVTPFLFVLTAISLAVASILNPYSWECLALVLGVFITWVSRSVQGFVKAQLSLIASNIELVVGFDTQRFRRLQSTRIIN